MASKGTKDGTANSLANGVVYKEIQLVKFDFSSGNYKGMVAGWCGRIENNSQTFSAAFKHARMIAGVQPAENLNQPAYLDPQVTAQANLESKDEDEDRVLEPQKDTTQSTSNGSSSDSDGRDSNNGGNNNSRDNNRGDNNSGDNNSGDNNNRDNNNSGDGDSSEHGHGNIDEDHTNEASIDEASSSGEDRDNNDDRNNKDNAHIGINYDSEYKDSIMDSASDLSSDLSNLTVWNIRYVTTIQFQSWNDIPYSLLVHCRFILLENALLDLFYKPIST